jgi:uncharacterized ferredoxin-like protein
MLLNPEKEDMGTMAAIILAAARTAPKAKGIDDIVTGLVGAKEKENIARTMEEMADLKGEKFGFFRRDAANVRQADTLILIGVKDPGVAKLNCGACGYSRCREMADQDKVNQDFRGPICAFKSMDLGIALGAAAAKAKDLCIDNRLMYSAGTAARKAGIMDAEMVIGMPLSVSGKNPFFDRG